MKIQISSRVRTSLQQRAFTLIEVMAAVSVIGVLFVTLYLGLTQGFAIIQVARENLRATQVLQERMETVRLYTWDQLNTAGFVPQTFTATFYPVGNQTNQGVTYQGTMVVTNATVAESYGSDLKMILVTLNWQSGNVTRQRQMKTLVSHYGLHNYFYR